MGIIQASQYEAINSLASDLKEEYLSSELQLDEYFRQNTESLESMLRLIVLHWSNPEEMGRMIKQQLSMDMDEFCADQAREELNCD